MKLISIAGLLVGATAAHAATIITPQAPGIEAALADRADIIAWEGFESVDWWKSGWWRDMNTNLPLTELFTTVPVWARAESNSVVHADAVGGSRVLAVDLKSGSHYGMSAKIALPDGTQNVFMRVYYKLPMGTWKPGGKDWGFHSGNYSAGTAATGEKLSVRSVIQSTNVAATQLTMKFYVYHLDQTYDYGTSYLWPNSGHPKGVWNCVEIQTKMNTMSGAVANRDGEIRAWINDEFKFEKTDLAWQNGTGINDIEAMDAFVYTGGAEVFPQQGIMYIDNMVIAKNRIGCMATGTEPTPLATPAGITWND